MDNKVTTIEQLVALDREQDAAWKVFSRQYQRECPEPGEPGPLQGLPWMMLPFGLVGLAAVLLSALRTGPVFAYIASQFSDGQGVGRWALAEGILATFAVDLAVVTFSFAIIVQNQAGKKNRKISEWVYVGFAIAIIAQIVGNLYGAMGILQLSDTVQGRVDLIVVVVMGLSGVVIALAIGEIMGHLWLGSQDRRQTLRLDYLERYQQWEEKKNKRWGRDKKKLGINSLEIPERSQTFANGPNYAEHLVEPSRTKPPRSQIEVIKFIEEHDAGGWVQAEIARKTDKSKATVHGAMKHYNNGYRTNGVK